MLYINIKGVMKTGYKVFAEVCNYETINQNDMTITCSKMEGGEIGYGILKETGKEICDGNTK